jgi:hypothetical protein
MAALFPLSETIDANTMTTYRIFKNASGDTRAVKVGFSWPAMILNMIWTIANGLWLGSVLVLVLIFGGLLLFAATVQESPVVASAMVVAGEVALLSFLGFRGNDWLASHLESQGYALMEVVEAPNPIDAVALAVPGRDAV